MCPWNNDKWLSSAVYFEMRVGINQSVLFVCAVVVAGGCSCVYCTWSHHNIQTTALCWLPRCFFSALRGKWKQRGKADTKTIVCLSVTVRKPPALWFLSYAHPLILKFPQLVTGHSWGQGTNSLRTDNGSAMSKIYRHGPDYRKEFHQFQTTCINKTSRERLEVNFQIAAMDWT